MDNLQDLTQQLEHAKSQIKQLDDICCGLSDALIKADEKMYVVKDHVMVQHFIIRAILDTLPEDTVTTINQVLQKTLKLDDKPEQTKELLEYLNLFFKK
ncbi:MULTISPECIES: hypothetical protein [Providencia]|uniref:hypothetical protein n=1 Tax=Providencia TaxID=586 RepID=UPI00234BB22D|nr:hypothetical protein [Providencia sp. PROV191]